MKKLFFISNIIAGILYAFDHSGYAKNPVILDSGVNRTDNIIATCGSQYCVFGKKGLFDSNNQDFLYSTNGIGSSTLTLNGVLPQNPPASGAGGVVFNIKTLGVGRNSHLIINNVHTLAGSTISVQSNASLDITLKKGSIVNASEYGPKSKAIIHDYIYVGNNASLHIKNTDFFISSAVMNTEKQSTTSIDADTIRLQKELTNQGKLTLQGHVYNIGQNDDASNLTATTVSTIANYGTLEVIGNLYNGGGNVPGDGIFDFPESGGGNLINYGGTITVSGNLTNALGDGRFEKKSSTIQIYGGTLKVNGVFHNQAGTTHNGTTYKNSVIIGTHNGQLGKIEGNLINDDLLLIKTNGLKEGNYTFLTGNLTGTGKTELIMQSGVNDFITATINGGSLNFDVNQNHIDSFKSTLSVAQKSILEALNDTLGNIYSYGGRNTLFALTADTQKGLQSAYFVAPMKILELLKNSTATQFHEQTELDIGVIGSGVLGDSLGIGGLGGIKVSGAYRINDKNRIYMQIAYAYGSLQQRHSMHELSNLSHNLQFSLGNQITLNNLVIDLGLHNIIGFFSTTRTAKIADTLLNAHGDFKVLNLNFDSLIGYNFSFGNLTVRPFAGLKQYYSMQTDIQEKGDFTVQAHGYNAYWLDLAFGASLSYRFNHIYLLNAQLDYDCRVLNTKDMLTLYFTNNQVTFQSPFQQRVGFSLASLFSINKAMKATLDGFFKADFNGIYYFGGNVAFKYQF